MDTDYKEILKKLASWLDTKAQEVEDISYHYEAEAIDEALQRIAELEQENERLRAECGLRQIQGYREGMERAAEICLQKGEITGLYIYSTQKDCARAIRAELEK